MSLRTNTPKKRTRKRKKQPLRRSRLVHGVLGAAPLLRKDLSRIGPILGIVLLARFLRNLMMELMFQFPIMAQL